MKPGWFITEALRMRVWDKMSTRCKEVPRWYRGLSHYQIDAAKELCHAIRDDIEQNSTYRVMHLLDKIGLNPKLKSTQIRTVMELSRGNDLAFLWFLMEIYYKSPDPNHYSSNEQLIMSCIFRMDLMPTLRQLDRILPLGHKSPEDVRRESLKRKQKEKEELRIKRERDKYRKQPRFTLPYFQLLPMPRSKKVSYYCNYPRRPAIDVHIPKEQVGPSTLWTRWFGKYELRDDRRIANSIIYDELNKIFENFSAASLKAKEVKALCKHHKDISRMEKSLSEKLKIITQDKLKHYIDCDVQAREERRNRIIGQLERASSCIRARFHEMAINTRINSVSKTLFARRADIDDKPDINSKPDFVFLKNVKPKKCKKSEVFGDGDSDGAAVRSDGGGDSQKTKKRSNLKKSRKSTKASEIVVENMEGGEHKEEGDEAEEAGGGDVGGGDASSADEDIQKFKIYEVDNGIKCIPDEANKSDEDELHLDDWKSVCAHNKPHTKPKPEVHRRQSLRRIEQGQPDKKRGSSSTKKISDCGCSDSQDEIKYFDVGDDEKPYAFNYRKIYHTTCGDNQATDIKHDFIKALVQDIDVLNKLVDEYDDAVDMLDPMLDAAVERNVFETFKEESNIFRKIYERYEKRAARPSTRLDFGRDVYDPEDRQLMATMLHVALERIAEDRRYVLASLPDAHMVPFLMEWICHRYGKIYTQNQRIQILKETKPLMTSLSTLLMEWEIPAPEGLSKVYKMVPYSKRNQLVRRSRMLRTQYNRGFTESMMEIARTLYFAQRPQLSSPSQKEIFFAYMPSRYNDLNFSVGHFYEGHNFEQMRRRLRSNM